MNPVELVLSKMPDARRNGKGWAARCPAHEDRRASLSIGPGDNGGAVLFCHAGCPTERVLSALGLKLADLMPERPDAWRPAPRATTPKPATFATMAQAIGALERQHGPRSALWTYHNADGEPVGVVLRWNLASGEKDIRPVSRTPTGWTLTGMPEPRPLYNLPQLLARPTECATVHEGEKASDAAASIGLLATTSPHGAKSAGKADWTPLAGRDVTLFPDNDPAGEAYAADVLGILRKLDPPARVRIVRLPDLPANGDIVDWLDALDSKEPETLRAEIQRLIDAAPIAAAPAEQSGPASAKPTTEHKRDVSQAELLVRLALARFRFGCTEAGEPFAVAQAGPNLATMFRGGDSALRSRLAKLYRSEHNGTPNASALSDAMTTLQGESLTAAPEAVALRVAQAGDAVVLDLGDATGRAVVVRPGQWELAERSPVLFRRTALTAALPLPERGGSLAELRGLLNVTDATWPLLRGWIVAALLPDIPHPILLLSGEAGAGKTTAARMLVGLVDPSPAPLRSEPRDGEAWAMAAAGSWAVCIDNVSAIPGWWSDCLCKAVTGDGWVRRTLYTNSDLSVLTFRRVVALTSIDAGALRGDLGDRLLLADLLPIADNARRTEGELDALYAQSRPRIFGGLLDDLADVLERLPDLRLPAMPRMADFGRVLAALDMLDKSDNPALPLYVGQRTRIAGDVVDSDAVASAIVRLVEAVGSWTGTASDLLQRITSTPAPYGWPRSAQGMGGRLKRLRPALRLVGIDIDPDRAPTRERTRTYTIARTVAQSLVQVVQTSENPPGDSAKADSLWTSAGQVGQVPAVTCPTPAPTKTDPLDELDELDNPNRDNSGDALDDYRPPDDLHCAAAEAGAQGEEGER
jgi:hypothetical protein